MRFDWIVTEESPQLLRDFIREKALPRKFMSAVKYHGGEILVNQQPVTVRYQLAVGDQVSIIPPIEEGHDTVAPSYKPIDIVYEDRDILIVNKPSGVVSIPSVRAPDTSMANRIKGYYVSQNYADQVIHIVTRLDRDTSGLMLIAKHRLAHAFFDRLLQQNALVKRYLAISSKREWPTDHGMIEAPIARHPESIIQRIADPSGQPAKTEYWVSQQYAEGSVLALQLHTGRTHQIRVHLMSIGGSLVGDTLYGPTEQPLKRQALHCHQLIFSHPFTHQRMIVTQSMPNDMLEWCHTNQGGK
ncbi:RluA family pseudouridine synthase [Aerococcaceae bacterium DSM 111020]|nr:RluA family pseudouridine synthase [Aerococcaceae bacterium DSM 111020]